MHRFLDFEQVEERQQPARAHLGDVPHRQVAADGVPALQKQLPGGGDGLLQRGRAAGRCGPGKGEGLRLDPALAGARLADVLDEGGADQAAGAGDVGG